MLITATAHEVGVNPKKLKGKALEDAIEKAISEKEVKAKTSKKTTPKATPKATAKKSTPKATKKATAKPKAKKSSSKNSPKNSPKTPSAKTSSTTKKDVKIEAPKELAKKETVELPKFKNIAEMKHFCVINGLNRIDGYILETKKKQVDFLKWIEDNLENAVPPAPLEKDENPHSPHEGVGELDNANTTVPPSATPNAPVVTNVKGQRELKVTPPMAVPPLKTGDNFNEQPTAISENRKMFEGQGEEEVVKVEAPNSEQLMRAYGKSILDTLMNEVMFRINGGITYEKLNGAIATASKEYEYEIVTETVGKHIKLTDRNGNTCRVPQQGSLPMV
jgi:hypothetical protein